MKNCQCIYLLMYNIQLRLPILRRIFQRQHLDGELKKIANYVIQITALLAEF